MESDQVNSLIFIEIAGKNGCFCCLNGAFWAEKRVLRNGRVQLIPEYEEIALAGGRMTTQLRHHGGREGVTGSCHQLLVDGGKSLLVDCGLFQGADGGSGNTLGSW
jgi:hypothetical protein